MYFIGIETSRPKRLAKFDHRCWFRASADIPKWPKQPVRQRIDGQGPRAAWPVINLASTVDMKNPSTPCAEKMS